MDAIENVAIILGSAIILAMLGMAARRSWIDRQQAKRQSEHRSNVAAA